MTASPHDGSTTPEAAPSTAGPYAAGPQFSPPTAQPVVGDTAQWTAPSAPTSWPGTGEPTPAHAVPGSWQGNPNPTPAAMPSQETPTQPSWTPTPTPPENVGRGLLFAVPGILAGVALTAIIWSFGFQWAMTQFVLAALAVGLYKRGSGGQVRVGVIALVIEILIGVAVSLFTCIGVDAYQVWADNSIGGSPVDFILATIFDPDVLGLYTREIFMFLLFAAFGTFSVIRSLIKSR